MKKKIESMIILIMLSITISVYSEIIGKRVATDVAAEIQGVSYRNDEIVSFSDYGAAAMLPNVFSKSGRIRIDALFVNQDKIVFSTDVDFEVGGRKFADEDLVEYDHLSQSVVMFWDGSAHGLPKESDLDAACMPDTANMYFSIDIDIVNTNGTGWYSNSDILHADMRTGGTPGFDRLLTRASLGLQAGDDIDALFIENEIVCFSMKSYYLDGSRLVLPSEIIIISTNTMAVENILSLDLEDKVVLSALDFAYDKDNDGLTDFEERSGYDEGASTWGESSIKLIPNGTSSPAHEDTDMDGASDAEEAMTGTNPRNQDDYLHITKMVLTNGSDVITWASIPGKTYAVYSNPDLLTGVFLPSIFMPEITATSSTTTITNDSGAGFNLFYQVHLDITP